MGSQRLPGCVVLESPSKSTMTINETQLIIPNKLATDNLRNERNSKGVIKQKHKIREVTRSKEG